MSNLVFLKNKKIPEVFRLLKFPREYKRLTFQVVK